MSDISSLQMLRIHSVLPHFHFAFQFYANGATVNLSRFVFFFSFSFCLSIQLNALQIEGIFCVCALFNKMTTGWHLSRLWVRWARREFINLFLYQFENGLAVTENCHMCECGFLCINDIIFDRNIVAFNTHTHTHSNTCSLHVYIPFRSTTNQFNFPN